MSSNNEQTPENPPRKTGRKLLENPVVGSLVVPIAIVLVGALIVFGVTTLLSTDRSHRDLVREMESKTFGNRWIAAYELSKLIATSSIPENEVPWVVQRLNRVYGDSQDPRTKDFIVVSLGALKHEKGLPMIEKILSKDESQAVGNTQFHSLVALGNYPHSLDDFDWSVVSKFLNSTDHGLQQAAVLALATHRVGEFQGELEAKLDSDFLGVRYAAAMGLVYFKNEKALPTLREMLHRELDRGPEATFSASELIGLQMNVLEALRQEQWTALNETLIELSKESENQQLALRAREVLNQLKN